MIPCGYRFVNVILFFDAKVFCGNHDRELFTAEQLAKITGMTAAPCSVVRSGVRIITLDGNFNSDGSPYRLRDTDWTDTFLPEDQLGLLRASLAESSEDTYIFIHRALIQMPKRIT